MKIFGFLKKIVVVSSFAFTSLIATETTFDKPAFTKAVISVIPKANENLELDQVRDVFKNPLFNAKITYATMLTEESFEQAVRSILNCPYQVMIVCYASEGQEEDKVHYAIVRQFVEGKVLLQSLGAEDKQEVWVSTSSLIEGMKILNKDHCPKGYITISDAEEEASLLAKHSS